MDHIVTFGKASWKVSLEVAVCYGYQGGYSLTSQALEKAWTRTPLLLTPASPQLCSPCILVLASPGTMGSCFSFLLNLGRLFVCLFVETGFLCSPGCPGTHFVDQAGLELRNPLASASQVLGLKACATIAQLLGPFLKDRHVPHVLLSPSPSG
jgi:hypothetical protein